MRFLPYSEVSSVPNVIIDGAATGRTVLTLSHWPKSGTPADLRADTSTEIVFRYLDSPALHVQADAVSNNHFDEDGLVGIYVLLNPSAAARRRNLLIDVAQAGDFGVFAGRDAARVAFALSAYASARTSPLPAEVFRLPYPQLAARLYAAMLGLFPHLLDNLRQYRGLWEEEDRELAASEESIEKGLVTFEERPQLDLAIVRIADGASAHAYALHSRTACSRLLLVQDARVELRYRYESWVQMASRRPAPRVDLSRLARELNDAEDGGASWASDAVDHITPALRLAGTRASSLAPDAVIARVERYLQSAPAAWDPYD